MNGMRISNYSEENCSSSSSSKEVQRILFRFFLSVCKCHVPYYSVVEVVSYIKLANNNSLHVKQPARAERMMLRKRRLSSASSLLSFFTAPLFQNFGISRINNECGYGTRSQSCFFVTLSYFKIFLAFCENGNMKFLPSKSLFFVCKLV